MIWTVDEWVSFLAVVAGFLVILELGFRMGGRFKGRSDDSGRTHLGNLQASLLGLLALLLGFTFAMAVSRFDTRKSLVLEEANAIGTAYLRTRFLPPAEEIEAARLLRSYVASRLDFYSAGIDPGRLAAAYATSQRIENRLWDLAAAEAARDPRSVPGGLFIQSLNDVIDLNEKRRVAFENHIPEAVIYLLFAVSVGAMGFLAFGNGLSGQRRFASTAFFAVLVALVLTVILDIDRPRRGLIRVSQDSMIRLQASMTPRSR